MLLNKKIKLKKVIITGGAGLNKNNIFLKIIKNNNKIALKNKKNKYLFKKIASNDYFNLSKTNKETFKNIISLNLKFAVNLNCEILLFWGTNDKDAKLWIARELKRHNCATLITTKSDHFAYLEESSKFNHEVINFIKNA